MEEFEDLQFNGARVRGLQLAAVRAYAERDLNTLTPG